MRRPPRRGLRWLGLRPPEQLADTGRTALANALRSNPGVAMGYNLLQRFRVLVQTRDREALGGWLCDAGQRVLPPFLSLVPELLPIAAR